MSQGKVKSAVDVFGDMCHASLLHLTMAAASCLNSFSGHIITGFEKARRVMFMSESSDVLQMACFWMTSRFFLLSTPNLVSRSSQASSIAEPLIPSVKLCRAVVQLSPFVCDSQKKYSKWRAYQYSSQDPCVLRPAYRPVCPDIPIGLF